MHAAQETAGHELAGTAVFITHLHSDHFGGLGEVLAMSWNVGRSRPLPVIGPDGIAHVLAGLELAYRYNTEYRSAGVVESNDPALASGVPRVVPSEKAHQAVVVYTVDELAVTAVPAFHGHVDPAHGYRVEYRGRSVYLSGDSLAEESLLEHIRGVDVMVFDTLDRVLLGRAAERLEAAGITARAERARRVMRYHADSADVGRLAEEAQPELLVLYHLIPAPNGEEMEKTMVSRVADRFSGRTIAARDGLEIFLPAGPVEDEGVGEAPRIVERGTLPRE